MDICDQAAEIIEADIRAAVEKRRRPDPGPSATHCDECEIRIPEERRRLVPGVRLCVRCKELQEAHRL